MLSACHSHHAPHEFMPCLPRLSLSLPLFPLVPLVPLIPLIHLVPLFAAYLLRRFCSSTTEQKATTSVFPWYVTWKSAAGRFAEASCRQ